MKSSKNAYRTLKKEEVQRRLDIKTGGMVKVVEWHGMCKPSKFLDAEFGEFTVNYPINMFGPNKTGRHQKFGHRLNGNNKKMSKEEAQSRLDIKTNYMVKIIKWDGANNPGIFLDCEYGEFTVNCPASMLNKTALGRHPRYSQVRKQYDTILNEAYNAHLANAKTREYISYLSKEEFKDIISKPCLYCGKFSKRKNYYTGAILELNSVDRRNNEPYYKLENSQSLCFDCQKIKFDKTHDDFLNKINEIVEYYFKKEKAI